MKPIVFVGSNGNLLQMVDNTHSTGRTVAGIVDSDYYGNTSHIENIPIIGSELDFRWTNQYDYFLATSWFSTLNDDVLIRGAEKRKRLIEVLLQNNITCTSLVHSRAYVPATCSIGQGVMIGVDAVLGNYVQVGDFAQIREQSYVAHEAQIGRSTVIQVGCYIGSEAEIGDESYIGVRATVVPQIGHKLIIPKNSFIKSRSLVTKSLTSS